MLQDIFFYILVFIISCATVLVIRNLRKTNGHLPPCEGWIPWLGCAIKFGENPIDFIEEKRLQYGSVFTLKVAGEHITFICDPLDLHLVFKSNKVSFQESVKDPVYRVAKISHESFSKSHTKMHDNLKGQLALNKLAATCENLFTEFTVCFGHLKEKIKHGEEFDLYDAVRSVMYRSVVHMFFGEGSIPVEKESDFKEFERQFMTYDDQFEYGTKLPHCFIREWQSARAWLLSKAEKVVTLCTKRMSKDSGNNNIFQNMMPLIDVPSRPSWMVLTLWAALANAIPMSFWVITFLLENKAILKRVQEEVDESLKGGRQINESVLAEMPFTLRCVMEAIRLRSPGMIPRRVVEPITVKGYTVPPGHMLSVSPFWINRNPDLYPNPNVFDPDRWSHWTPMTLPETFIPFGGGRYMCPGRWFALMEIHMFVAMFIHSFNCTLISKVPDFCKLHLVGTQQPLHSCTVRMTTR